MDRRRAPLTALTLTTKAMARLPNNGCISSSGNRSPSLIDSSRSSFSIRAWRRLRSPSADWSFWGEASDEYLRPDLIVLGTGSWRRSAVGVSPAFRLRRATNAGRSAVFTGAATVRRQSPGPHRTEFQLRADAHGIPAFARWFLFARCPDPACPQGQRLARRPVLPDPRRSHRPPADA